jgi:hypothetical protein
MTLANKQGEAMNFPTIEEVTQELWARKRWLRENSIVETDVRLQVYPDGQWAIRTGSSDFDQDHRGYWGAGCLNAEDPATLVHIEAKDLIEQVKDQAAENGEEV